MEEPMFAIVHWEDKFTSIINIDHIKFPRKPVTDYEEGEFVIALYGKKKYKARISEISGDRTYLASKKTTDGNFPLKFSYEESKAGSSCMTRTGSGDNLMEIDTGKDKTTIKKVAAKTDTGKNDTTFKEVRAAADVIRGDQKEECRIVDTPGCKVMEKPAVARKDKVDPGEEMQSSRVESENPGLNVLTPRPRAHHSNTRPSGRLEKRVDNLESEVKELRSSLKRKFSDFSEIRNVSAEKDRMPAATSSSSSNSSSHVGLEELLQTVQHVTVGSEREINECLRRIVFKKFSRQDLVECSRTGKKTNQSPDAKPRPPLDLKKMRMVEQAVMTKCSISRDVFKKKFDNLVKMERR